MTELKRKDKNDYWIWFENLSFRWRFDCRIWLESLSFRRKLDWFNDWSFYWYFIWDLDKKWFFTFFLDLDDRRDTINDLVETQHSINVIFFVLYEHSRKRSWSQLLSFRDRFSFHSVVDCFNSTKMSERRLSFRVDFVEDNWFVDHRRAISKIINCFD